MTTAAVCVAPPLCTDAALAAVLWRPAETWTGEEIRDYLSRRDGNRGPFSDPKCEAITHYRRSGKHARYEFRCLLGSRNSGGESAPFWVPYLDLCALPEGKAHLSAKGWVMRDHFGAYSDGEDVWDSGGDSHDEELVARRRRRGRAHELVRAPRRSQRAK